MENDVDFVRFASVLLAIDNTYGAQRDCGTLETFYKSLIETIRQLPREKPDQLGQQEKIERLVKELDAVQQEANMEREEASHRAMIQYREGMIEGLKFSIRCNGVSGADVKG